MNREEVVQKVLAQVEKNRDNARPKALLIGQAPPVDLGWSFVSSAPYRAVVIGSMSACELLRFPDEPCADALLQGIPVYLWDGALDLARFSSTTNRAFRSRLLSARRQLSELGVRTVGVQHEGLLTAEEVRRRLREGLPIEGRLTPLARDVLEGKV